MRVRIENPSLAIEERTYITSDYSSGTTLTVKNNNGFTTNWWVIVGEPGTEDCETQMISSTTSSTTITLASALSFAHSKSTPVYLCQYNKIVFEQKVSGGSYTAISTSPLSIHWEDDSLTTTIVVPSGATTDNYRWAFYNTYTGDLSSYSDALPGTGLTRLQVGYLIEQLKKNPQFEIADDDMIIRYFNDYQDLVYENMPQAWWFTKEGTAVATAASTYKYAISTYWSDFLSMKFCLYRYISGSNDMTYPLTFTPTVEFYNLKCDASQPTDDNGKNWTLLPPDSGSAKGYIALHPTPETTACYIKPVYYYELTELDTYGDTVVIPHSKGYIDYASYRICDEILSNTTLADKFNRRVTASITALKRRSKRQRGQPELFRFRGQRGWANQFGKTHTDSQTAKELYW